MYNLNISVFHNLICNVIFQQNQSRVKISMLEGTGAHLQSQIQTSSNSSSIQFTHTLEQLGPSHEQGNLKTHTHFPHVFIQNIPYCNCFSFVVYKLRKTPNYIVHNYLSISLEEWTHKNKSISHTETKRIHHSIRMKRMTLTSVFVTTVIQQSHFNTSCCYVKVVLLLSREGTNK